MNGSTQTWLGITLVVAATELLRTTPVHAQLPADLTFRAPIERQEARALSHFEKALELYRAGRYALARDQLEQAAALDPNGKDLFFNLALVQEKLGRLDEAIAALERFRELEPDPVEQERALVTMERLRGAQAARLLEATRSRACPEPRCPANRAPSTRLSPALIGAGSLALAGLVVGSIFGVRALSYQMADKQTSAFTSITELRERGNRAERDALVADLAFALTAAAGGTMVGIYLLESKVAGRSGALMTLGGDF